MNYETQLGTITSIERRNNSTNGNPAYEISYEYPLGSGSVISRRTQSDAACSYEVGNPDRRVGRKVLFHLTRAGRIAYMSTP
jgi:hypothetical protein